MNSHIVLFLRRLIASSFLLITFVVATSCDDNDAPAVKKVEIDKVSLYLDFNFTVTGDILLTLRDTETNETVSSSSLTIDGFDDDNDGWNDFTFSPAATVTVGKQYQLEVTRTNPNTPYSDVALWWTAADDVYPHGDYSTTGAAILAGDFAFRTYLSGELDQEQAIVDEVSILDNSTTLIQGFIPEGE